jgi:toxin ParE1/3/4
MKPFRVTPRALADLDVIAEYTLATWGERQTEKYLSELKQRFQWLADHPRAGRSRGEVGEGFRSYPHGSHVIFYLIERDYIAIIGVPHGSMDIEAYFKQPD